ncbi:HlyD family secretion protein [Xanthobacter sp. DSM 24535]|uniref:HlyD family secretion protein n=1 Tax=Roseixanthobacter psychrophilus TaxID=3119917 RepID=UPI00372BAD5E
MNITTDPAKLKSSPLPSPAEPALPIPKRQGRLRLALKLLAAAGLVVGVTYAGYEYWTSWRFEVSTDDAYVQADIVSIAPQVAGYLRTVEVTDNQPVKQGQVLATIDPRDYQAAVDQAEADVAEAKASIEDHRAQISEQQAQIGEARAQIDADQATLTFAQQNEQRFGTLAHDGYGSVQTAQQATSQIGQAQAQVAHDKAALDAAQKQVDILQAQLAEAQATLGHNQAVLEKAKLDLGYTVLRAPADGVVGARTLRVGQFVQPGTQLLAVVPLQATYIVANYKETQLTHVGAGQKVAISVDTFPGTLVHGSVQSLAPASGQEFALLPPDNATGNFTKIVQRIPVRIAIDPTDPLAGLLRPGMSVTTTITLDAQHRRAVSAAQ